MLEHLTIKTATIGDLENLAQISSETFKETYSDCFSPDLIENYVHEKFNSTTLKKELVSKLIIYLLAFYDNRLIGYAKIKNQSQPHVVKTPNSIEIERLYVLHRFQKLKIGFALMQKCIDQSISLNCDMIWLGVWEKNAKAISFYEKLGFEKSGSINFLLGDQTLNDFVMCRSLNPPKKTLETTT